MTKEEYMADLRNIAQENSNSFVIISSTEDYEPLQE